MEAGRFTDLTVFHGMANGTGGHPTARPKATGVGTLRHGIFTLGKAKPWQFLGSMAREISTTRPAARGCCADPYYGVPECLVTKRFGHFFAGMFL